MSERIFKLLRLRLIVLHLYPLLIDDVFVIAVVKVCLFLLFLLFDNLHEQFDAFEEVILVLVLRVHLKYANDTIVLGVDHVVKLWPVLEFNFAIDYVLPQNLVRELADLLQLFSFDFWVNSSLSIIDINGIIVQNFASRVNLGLD